LYEIKITPLDVLCTIDMIWEEAGVKSVATTRIADNNGEIVRYEVERHGASCQA